MCHKVLKKTRANLVHHGCQRSVRLEKKREESLACEVAALQKRIDTLEKTVSHLQTSRDHEAGDYRKNRNELLTYFTTSRGCVHGVLCKESRACPTVHPHGDLCFLCSDTGKVPNLSHKYRGDRDTKGPRIQGTVVLFAELRLKWDSMYKASCFSHIKTLPANVDVMGRFGEPDIPPYFARSQIQLPDVAV